MRDAQARVLYNQAVQRIASLSNEDDEKFLRSGPRYLYKYRGFEKLEHVKDIFLDRVLFFAHPDQLNDEYELKPIIDGNCSREEFIDFCHEQIILDHPEYTEEEITREIHNVISTHFPLAPETIHQFEEKLRYHYSQFGVLSLDADPLIPRMWERYADDYTGICIQFDRLCLAARKNIFGAKPVTYSKERPRMPTIASHEAINEAIEKACRTKLEEWSYEHEWRIVDPLPLFQEKFPRGQKQHFPSGVLTGVILGPRISEEHARLIQSWFTEMNPKPRIFQAVINSDDRSIKIPGLNN